MGHRPIEQADGEQLGDDVLSPEWLGEHADVQTRPQVDGVDVRQHRDPIGDEGDRIAAAVNASGTPTLAIPTSVRTPAAPVTGSRRPRRPRLPRPRAEPVRNEAHT